VIDCCISARAVGYTTSNNALRKNTVVWEKFVVENIHVKIICFKNFVVAGIRQKFFTVKFFTIEFFLFKLVAVSIGQEAVTH